MDAGEKPITVKNTEDHSLLRVLYYDEFLASIHICLRNGYCALHALSFGRSLKSEPLSQSFRGCFNFNNRGSFDIVHKSDRGLCKEVQPSLSLCSIRKHK